MKISIASDHNGVIIKEKIKKYLLNLGYEAIDLGSNDSQSVDYPRYAFELGKNVKNNNSQLGILICGTGIGMSIACNKIKGIRCCVPDSDSEKI